MPVSRAFPTAFPVARAPLTRLRGSRWRALAGVLLTFLLASCGGGGEGSSSITVDKRTVQFTASTGSAPTTQEVTVTFQGDGVIVGYAPGVIVPPWLAVSPGTQVAANTATFQLTGFPGSQLPGTYRTSLRFITGTIPAGGTEEDITGIRFVDVAISLTVVDLGLSTQTLAIDATSGLDVAPGSFRITSNGGAGWRVTSSQPWLTLDRTSGSGSADVGYTVDTSQLGTGTYNATIRVTHVASGAVLTIQVTTDVSAPDLSLTPQQFALTVGGDTTTAQLTLPLAISDELGGSSTTQAVNWQLADIDVPWLTLNPASGTSAPGLQASVQLRPAGLRALDNGEHTGRIRINYTTADGLSHSRIVPVNLTLALPRVEWVAPYVVAAQQAHEIVLQGSGFNGIGDAPVMFGDIAAPGRPTIISDTQMRITYPTLAAGTYAVRVPNALNATSSARLLVKNERALPGGTFPGGGTLKRILFDDERQVVYGVDWNTDELRRFARNGSSWTMLPAISTGRTLADAAISPDGRVLVMITEDMRVFELDLTTADAAPRETVRVPLDSWSSSYYLLRDIVFTNHNRAVITSAFRGSGSTPAYLYDVDAETITAAPGVGSLYIGTAHASGDGSVVLLPQNGLSPPPEIAAFNTATGRGYMTGVHMNMSDIAINRDGSRMIMADGHVYDRYFGRQATFSSYVARFTLSPDGTRAYVYVMNSYTGDPERIDIHDLTGTAGGSPPVIGSIPLAANIRAPGAYSLEMAVSRDGKTLFVWASAALVVIPLP